MVELSLVNSHDRSRGTKWHAIDRNMQELPDASRCQLIELEVCSSKSYKSRNMDPNDDMMWPINSNLQVDYASHPLISMFSGLMCQPATWRPIELYGSLALDRLRCARKERSLRCLVRGGPFQLHELLLPNPHRPRKLPMFSGHFEGKKLFGRIYLSWKGCFFWWCVLSSGAAPNASPPLDAAGHHRSPYLSRAVYDSWKIAKRRL